MQKIIAGEDLEENCLIRIGDNGKAYSAIKCVACLDYTNKPIWLYISEQTLRSPLCPGCHKELCIEIGLEKS